MSEKVQLNQTELNVSVALKDESAPWLVFSNSLLTDLSIFDAQITAFAKDYNCLRYDQRGHGGSAVSQQAVNFDVLSDDLLGLINHFNISRCIFVGLSMGVPTGFAAYQKQPELFNGLVLIDGQAKSAPAAAEQWQARIDLAKEKGLEEFCQATVQRWITPANHDAKIPALVKMMASTPWAGFEAGATALKGYDFYDVLPSITCPALLLAGKQDGNMPLTMQAMAEQIEKARFCEIEEAGHVPCYEQPEKVNAAMFEFLNEVQKG